MVYQCWCLSVGVGVCISDAAFQKIIDDPDKALSVADMVSDMMKSDEFTMVYLYWKVLGHEPDSEGRRKFADMIEGKAEQKWPLSATQMIDTLLYDPSFATSKGIDPSGTDALNKARTAVFCHEMLHFAYKPADVTFLYIKILGRWPDEEANEHYNTKFSTTQTLL